MKVSDLEVIRGEKREPCVYCGKDPHPVPLACPRIAGIGIGDDGTISEIYFWQPSDEPVAS